MGKEKKDKNKSAKISNSKITLSLKNKQKSKQGKQSLKNTRKLQTEMCTNIEIFLQKPIIRWLTCQHCTNISNIS